MFAGGGLLAIGRSLTIRDCIFVDNLCDFGGGIYAQGARLTLERCTLERNESFFFGAGIDLYVSESNLHGVTIRNNRSINNNGGGIHAHGAILEVKESLLDANDSGSRGANIAVEAGTRLSMSDVVVRNGFTLEGNGGGLWADGSMVEIARCIFERNNSGDLFSNREGGGLSASNGSLRIENTHFLENTSSRGGAIHLFRAEASIRSTRFTRNSIRSGSSFFLTEGGALATVQSATLVSRCTFEDNTATSSSPSAFGPIARGGAVWCDTSGLQIRGCLFQGNHAFYDSWADPSLSKVEAGAQGGALFGPALVSRCRFLGNRATSNPAVFIGRAEGGAVFGASLVSHSSFIGNEVMGIGPIPDRGPAAELATLECCLFAANLPPTLPPLGPHCTVLCD